MPEEVRAEHVKLSWDPPLDDGGTPITNYLVRYMDIDSGEWVTACTVRYIHLPCLILFYRIHSFTTTGFYFSKWVFGWGSIEKNPKKVDFLTKKCSIVVQYSIWLFLLNDVPNCNCLPKRKVCTLFRNAQPNAIKNASKSINFSF